MSAITKQELVDRIAESTQIKQTLAKAIIQNFLDEIISELAKGNRFEFRDFGVFEPRDIMLLEAIGIYDSGCGMSCFWPWRSSSLTYGYKVFLQIANSGVDLLNLLLE